ncbi:MAG TPA: DUF805 domain-containing protein [Thermomicrobiales bacterium]|nr:DUF805 domain-containing protein [Thermomicrobiales bacterium]
MRDLGKSFRWEAVFSTRGRIGRRTFWMLSAPFLVLVGIIGGLMLRDAYRAEDTLEVWDSAYFTVLGVSLVVGLFGVRRLHDRGISGKWMLLVVGPLLLAYIPPLFPVIYMFPVFLVVLFVIVAFVPGDAGRNTYGAPGSGSPFVEEFRRGQKQG